MTRDDVIRKLTDRGFTLTEAETGLFTRVEHRGETVGSLDSDSVRIAKHYPSLNPHGLSVPYAEKTIVMYSQPMSDLDMAIQLLIDSPERIDEEKRKKRIDAIRRYFDDRRSASLDDRRSPIHPARPILSSYMGSPRLYPPRRSTHADEDSTT